MYLHENKELFREAVEVASEESGLSIEKIEKDYYVTMILKLLSKSEKLTCVFKGGTSLSKCFHAIKRFSEDIDITFTEHIGEARRKKIKYNLLKPIADELGLVITNWNEIESDRDYNVYLFSYFPVVNYRGDEIKPEIKFEISLVSYAFPTEYRVVSNYLVDFLPIDNINMMQIYDLDEFEMCVQSLERTFIDKIFAICDYYMMNKSKRYSRHLYDLYQLYPLITIDDMLKSLLLEVRTHRQKLPNCPSARQNINIKEIIENLSNDDFYKTDYENITEYFIAEPVPYNETIKNIKKIAKQLF